MNDLSILLTCYTTTSSLIERQLRLVFDTAKRLPALRWVVVDDCSPVPWPEMTSPNLTVARIDQDIPHNNPGASNLAISLAKSEWVARLDLDHIGSVGLFRALMHRAFDPHTLYHLPRNAPNVYSPNVFVAHQDGLIQAGCYDEDFAGHYGSEDKYLLHCWQRHGGTFVHLADVEPLDVNEGTRTGLAHDPTRNRELFKRKVLSGEEPTNHLRFTWHMKGGQPC